MCIRDRPRTATLCLLSVAAAAAVRTKAALHVRPSRSKLACAGAGETALRALELRGGAGAKVLSPKRSLLGKIMDFIASFFDPAFGGNYGVASAAAQASTAAPAAAPAKKASRMNRGRGGRTISVDDLKQMEGGRVKPIKTAAEMKRAISSSKLTVVDFWASWCGPCMQIKPKFAKISDRYGGVGFYAVDVDAAKPVSQAHGVSSMPTFVFFKGGKEIERFSGADENKLSQLIERLK